MLPDIEVVLVHYMLRKIYARYALGSLLTVSGSAGCHVM